MEMWRRKRLLRMFTWVLVALIAGSMVAYLSLFFLLARA